MNLLFNNKEPWDKDDVQLLTEFVHSDYYKDQSKQLDVRLALFIASKDGLNSTFTSKEFKRIFQELIINKHKYIKGTAV